MHPVRRIDLNNVKPRLERRLVRFEPERRRRADALLLARVHELPRFAEGVRFAQLDLAEDEILIYNSDKQWRKGDTLDFLDNEYKVAGTVNYQDVYYIINPSMALFEHALTFNAAIAVVCVIFLLVYALVYKVTSREYYKIVNAG